MYIVNIINIFYKFESLILNFQILNMDSVSFFFFFFFTYSLFKLVITPAKSFKLDILFLRP